MDSLELFALQRQNALLQRRLEIIEAILERSGIIDAVLKGGPSSDPAPSDLVRVSSLAAGGGMSPVADPAPGDLGRLVGTGGLNLAEILRRFRPGDPAPVDISRFSKVQLESALHDIAAERARLDSLEGLLRQQMNTAGGG